MSAGAVNTPDSRTDIASTMRAAVARRYGGPEVVDIESMPVPVAGEGELLIEVRATSLNALDWHFLTGTPYLLRITNGLRRPKRLVPGADVAGSVVAIGDAVTGFAIGDEVFGECEAGGCATYVATAATNVVKKPSRASVEEAGATPVAGLTAVQALRTHANVQPGERVLINGAAGGVGTSAVQVAKALGAEVTAVCITRNVEMVRALGADEVVDYTRDDFTTGGARFDVMVDNVGSRTSKENLGVLVPGGRYVAVSGPKGNRWLDPMRYVARMWWACKRAGHGFHQFVAAPNHGDLTFLAELLADGRLRPAVQRVIGLDDVADGLAEIGSGHARSKIVVVPDQNTV